MRSAFVFTEAGAGAVGALLDEAGTREADQWTVKGVLYVEIQEPPDWSDGWPAAVVAQLTAAFGHAPPRLVAISLSGRPTAQAEAKRIVTDLIQLGVGVAVDDYSGHLWATDEITADLIVNGRRFLEPASTSSN